MEKSIKLIDGTYTAAEASEILQNLLNEKIRFHNMKSFSMKEKFGIEATGSIQRIKELKKASLEVADLVKTAEVYGYKIEISGMVELKITIPEKQEVELDAQKK